jgi:hypothetical protein
VLGAHSVRYVTSFRQWRQEQPDGRLTDGVVLAFEPPWQAAGSGGDGEWWPTGPVTSNTEATQVRALVKINTPVTRTRRHSPVHGGTTARISM